MDATVQASVVWIMVWIVEGFEHILIRGFPTVWGEGQEVSKQS